MCILLYYLIYPIKNTPIKTKASLTECCATVTRSATDGGIDCEGYNFTVTATETATRCDLDGNCYNAFRAAQTAATVEATIHATIGVAVITAPCGGSQEP